MYGRETAQSGSDGDYGAMSSLFSKNVCVCQSGCEILTQPISRMVGLGKQLAFRRISYSCFVTPPLSKIGYVRMSKKCLAEPPRPTKNGHMKISKNYFNPPSRNSLHEDPQILLHRTLPQKLLHENLFKCCFLEPLPTKVCNMRISCVTESSAIFFLFKLPSAILLLILSLYFLTCD